MSNEVANRSMSESDSARKGPIHVLVTLATGKQGSAICDAFLAAADDVAGDDGTPQKRFRVYGTSRDAQNQSLLGKGVTPVKIEYNNETSLLEALQASKPSSKCYNEHTAYHQQTERQVSHRTLNVHQCVQL